MNLRCKTNNMITNPDTAPARTAKSVGPEPKLNFSASNWTGMAMANAATNGKPYSCATQRRKRLSGIPTVTLCPAVNGSLESTTSWVGLRFSRRTNSPAPQPLPLAQRLQPCAGPTSILALEGRHSTTLPCCSITWNRFLDRFSDGLDG